MTQAFNLGQLANKVNTSGQLDASTGLVNTTAVANGGTGQASLTTGTVLLGNGTSAVNMYAGTTTNDALIWNGSTWTSAPVSSVGGGGGYQLTKTTSPSSYTKPASLKAVKVTVVGSGGNGGASATYSGLPPRNAYGGGGGGGGGAIVYIPAPTLPASAIPITAGTGTNSFGTLVSCTAGSAGGNAAPPANPGAGGAGGVGSSPQPAANSVLANGAPGSSGVGLLPQQYGFAGDGGGSLLSSGAHRNTNATAYGGGGGGGSGTGSTGVVIIEEFF